MFDDAHRNENTTMRLDSHKTSQKNLTAPLESPEQRLANTGSKTADLLENIDQEYVMVSEPAVDASSSSVSSLKPSHFPYRSSNLSIESSNLITRLSAPMPIIGVAANRPRQIRSLESLDSASGVSHGSADSGDEQPSADCMVEELMGKMESAAAFY